MRSLVEHLDNEVVRIAEKESRPRAEVERLLILAGVRAYNAGESLRFRVSAVRAKAERLDRTVSEGARLAHEIAENVERLRESRQEKPEGLRILTGGKGVA